ncbi:PmoA family protein [uncultured Paludibaculum sp.]|uniref:DUF6807 domain-containing protein n=1 Tax=uncultured Paludibaculum sp. TaxID=1765020 RepID=UPI002AAAE003|nr:PmoA family protein [uncultured Paludibaculum sp.]
MHRRNFLLGSAATLVAANDQPLAIQVGSRTAAGFYSGEEWDKPFLYPIKTVSGKVLSRGWPLEPREGDSKDHVWHRGFWYGHGSISGADFWREQGRDKTARLINKASPRAGRGRVAVDLAMTPPSGKPIGSMRQEFQFADHGNLRMLDAVITIHADAGQSLVFGDSDDGGFAFRLCEAFREDKGARLRNSEGHEGTKEIWGKPALWVDYSAMVDGVRAGVAMFDHPANLRHPTRWHARGYGLNAANPFALKSFTKDPAADGGYTLPAGDKLVLRYRTVIYEGSPDIGKLYAEYARR